MNGVYENAASLQELHFHDLRGTAITVLAEQGCTGMRCLRHQFIEPLQKFAVFHRASSLLAGEPSVPANCGENLRTGQTEPTMMPAYAKYTKSQNGGAEA